MMESAVKMERGVRRSQAVEAARDVFWARGYNDASISEIVGVTGLNRYALYSEFGGKRELFLACLADFFEERARRYTPAMQDVSKTPFERLRSVLSLMIDDMASEDRGCLMCQTAVEVARDDQEIAAAVERYFGCILEFLAAPLREAQAQGALNPNLTPEAAAQLLFDAKLSLGVYARAGAERAQMQRIVDATLAAISAPQAPN